MKNKYLLSLLIIFSIFLITACGSSSSKEKSKSNVFKMNDVIIIFDQEDEFHDFKFKNAKELEKDESKQSLHLEYNNKDIYDGRFTFRISLAFSEETNLNDFLDGHESEKVEINGINWEKVSISSKTDGKDTQAIVYATEKDSTIYAVTAVEFKEDNINIENLAEIFINGVTLNK